MEQNKVKNIHDFEQSIWLDFIDRKLIKTGALKNLIDVDGVRGVTSNPAIFEKAISSSSDYDEDIQSLLKEGKNNEAIFYGMAIKDIQQAADILLPVYEEKVSAADGFVSLEVSPHLARDTQGTNEQANDLWRKVDRKNVMIKIPGTEQGLAAIETCISNGININVTLLFGLKQYRAVTEAYITGLEKRLANGHSIDQVASVASFFISRVDIMVDPILAEKGNTDLQGQVAISLAKAAYQIYKEVFSSDRFNVLKSKGASPQRLLWASTSNKNPAFKDTRYVEALIGPKTVNTIPLETLEAFRDHGVVANTLENDLDKANAILDQTESAGIDMEEVSNRLEEEGIQKFKVPYDKMLHAIELSKK